MILLQPYGGGGGGSGVNEHNTWIVFIEKILVIAEIIVFHCHFNFYKEIFVSFIDDIVVQLIENLLKPKSERNWKFNH